MDRVRYIAIEGVDGTGKSTTAQLLAKQSKALGVSSPHPPFEGRLIRDVVDSGPERVRALYYRMAIENDSVRIRARLREQPPIRIVSDRSPLSTWVQAWHAMPNKWQDWDVFAEGLLLPDLVVLLTLPRHMLETRIRERAKWTEASRAAMAREADSAWLLRMQDVFRAGLAGMGEVRSLEISTETLAPDQVVERVASAAGWG